MRKVSEGSQELLSQLISWEMMGRDDLDVKILLRQIPLADLSVIASNLAESDDFVLSSAVARLVLLEMHYRTGHLGGDWDLQKDGNSLSLNIKPLAPVKFLKNFLVETT